MQKKKFEETLEILKFIYINKKHMSAEDDILLAEESRQ
jgi:hypothetical protein